MPKYAIPLYSGIGNIIQSIPFANEMKRRYGTVVGFDRSDFKSVLRVVENNFDKIFISQKEVPEIYKIAIIPHRRSFPEYEAWFVDNKEAVPEKYSHTGISVFPFDMPEHKQI